MSDPIRLSYSRVTCYRECPYKHYLRYVQGVKPRTVGRPLHFGRDFHKLLENRWVPNKPGTPNCLAGTFIMIEEAFNRLPDSVQDNLGLDYPREIKTIFEDYQALYTARPQEEIVFGRSQHEVAFELPIGKYKGKDVCFVGVFDEVLITEEGRGDIVEHKTFSQKPNPLFLTMNTQIALYAKAYKKLYGRPLRNVVWDYIKSTPATEPALLKSGKLSEAATKSVTPYSYRRACQRHGLVPDKRQEDKYAFNFEEFFFRRVIEVNPAVVKAVWSSFKQSVLDILQIGATNKAQFITQNCGWCDYKDICAVEFAGGEAADIIKEKYDVKEGEV